jgi:hypothetical protein
MGLDEMDDFDKDGGWGVIELTFRLRENRFNIILSLCRNEG